MRVIRKLLITFLAAIVFWIASSGLVTWRLTSRHRAPFEEPPPAGAEAHRFETLDQLQIGAWLIRGRQDRPCVVLIHGNGGSRTSMRAVIDLWAKEGVCVFAISVRAHGDSDGDTNDFGYSAANDVVAAVGFLEKEFPERKIIIHGRSLGAAAAIFAAKSLGTRVSGYLLEQPYRDLESATWNRLRMFVPDVIGGIAYLGLMLWSKLILVPKLEDISPAEHARNIPFEVSVVLLAGTNDRHATLEDVEAVFAGIQGPVLLTTFRGAEHVDLDQFDPSLYRQSMWGILGGVIGPKGPSPADSGQEIWPPSLFPLLFP